MGVRVFAENYKKRTSRHIASGYFTFVAVDACRSPISVPILVPESVDEKRRYAEAELRRVYRQKQDKELGQYRAKYLNQNE